MSTQWTTLKMQKCRQNYPTFCWSSHKFWESAGWVCLPPFFGFQAGWRSHSILDIRPPRESKCWQLCGTGHYYTEHWFTIMNLHQFFRCSTRIHVMARPISHLPIYLLIYQLYLAALLSQLGALPSHDELNDSHVSSSSPCTPAHVLPCAQVPHLTKVKVLQRFHGLVEELSQQSNVECSLSSTVTTEHWQHISSQEGVQTYKIRDHILRC